MAITPTARDFPPLAAWLDKHRATFLHMHRITAPRKLDTCLEIYVIGGKAVVITIGDDGWAIFTENALIPNHRPASALADAALRLGCEP